MGKLQLLLLDEDSHYAERFAAFVRTSEYGDKLQIKLFTKCEYVYNQLETAVTPSILLVSDHFKNDFLSVKDNVFVISLSSSLSGGQGLVTTDVPRVYRYQPLQQLLSLMLAFYKERNDAFQAYSNKGTKVLSLYSALGNSGKTVSAIHLAKELAFRGKRVFYLSLESPSSVSQVLRGTDPQHFSQILYYTKSAPALLEAKLELIKKNDPRLGFDFLSPCHHPREALEMKADHIQLLIEALIELNSYDYIVLDLEASLHARILRALALCDHIFWIVLDDLNCLYKTTEIRKALGLSNKVHYILNKYTGSAYNDFQSADIIFKGFLPYIPVWKTVHSAEQILSASIFSEQVYGIFESAVLSSQEGTIA
ncbi:AAA family ATPase [Paenibacillus eucommiae]|uniref:Cellulose biosynthesis protein BcsQ n=1 Tax=Paenibacillus eucommiae TaxID=1355755 RepID=A0ABS4J5Z3_9BACL|nr:AAA family ATPase [Paenibacillus eucommiae]MBP1995238.1 cellulose biosynthesis protein BcsQ [Paenibacillus eucommiae]